MVDKRKRVDRKRYSCKQELNIFSDMSIDQKTLMDMEDKEFWKMLAQVNGKKESLKLNNIVINC